MAGVANEAVFQGFVQVAKCVLSLSKMSKDGSWERMWYSLLAQYKSLLDMSSVQLDGTHTPAKRGGEGVGYQGRKKSKTTNMLILTDNQGIPLVCSDPVAGNQHDSYKLVE